ncbi:MAG: cyclodeaminase/cyclohydrolase family protein, partial [Lancefieldella rimae]
LRKELLELVNEDSRQFLLVSDAFAIPKDNPSRSACIEEALIAAAKPPLRVMEVICETIALLEEMQVKGSRLLLSDVGCGAALSRGALEAASHTVFVNTRSMQDRVYAASVNERAKALMDEWIPRAEALSRHVSAHLQGEEA